MKIIPISGKSGSGKDFVANEIKRQLELLNKNVLIVHYADVLKFICKSYFDWNGVKDTSGRNLLQYVGTEQIRNSNKYYFTNFIVQNLNIFNKQWDFVIIPDARFENEIECLNDVADSKVYPVRVNREFKSKLTIEQQNHESETSLDEFCFYFTIKNDNTISGVAQEVYYLLRSILNDE